LGGGWLDRAGNANNKEHPAKSQQREETRIGMESLRHKGLSRAEFSRGPSGRG
jgi:hypothetical protein